MRAYTWITLAGLAWTLVACSTANRGATPLPERMVSDGFTVSALEGQGTFTPEWSVSQDADGALVTVTAAGAEELSAAFVHVHYDTARYTPDSVEFGDFLGAEDETLSLALTDVADVVPVGIVQVASANVSPRAGGGVLARVRFKAGPFLAPRVTSKSPCGGYNAVEDLTRCAQDPEAGTVTLRWTEKNLGDYNNDCLVGIQDLTPLGVYFGMWVYETSDPLRAGLADGNGDGMINLTDITQIGQNFGNKLTGYLLYTDAAGTCRYSEGIDALRCDALSDPLNPDPSHPLQYCITVELPPLEQVEFTVAPVDDGDLANPGPVSNVAVVRVEGDPPEPVASLTAVSDEDSGHQTVDLSWAASDSPYAESYVLERQLVGEGNWGALVEVPCGQTTYSDHDESFVQGEQYAYRVAVRDDLAQLSDWTSSDPVTPYFAEGPAPPQNLVTNNDIVQEYSIEVSWDPPADTTGVQRYRVYRQDAGAGPFSKVADQLAAQTSYTDSGLTEGVSYTYYAVSVNAGGVESEPSNTDSSTPSEFIEEIQIFSLTTDKTTHYFVGGEPDSHLVVTTDYPPTEVVWDAGGGQIVGEGCEVGWQPEPGMAYGEVTVTCTVKRGSAEDSATINLYVTREQIKVSLGDNGHFIDFSAECLEAIAISGDIIPNRSFSYYADGGHVVLMDRWDSS